MAVVPICYKMPYHYHILQTQSAVRPQERCLSCECSASPQRRCLFTISNDTHRRWQLLYPVADIVTRTKIRGVNAYKGAVLKHGLLHFKKLYKAPALHGIWSSAGEQFGIVWRALKSSTNEDQLRSLETYFEKLQGESNLPSSDSCDRAEEALDRTGQINAKEELERLNAYLGELSKATSAEKYVSSTFDGQAIEENSIEKAFSLNKDSRKDEKAKGFMGFTNNDIGRSLRRSKVLQENNETSHLYLIGFLASINIAVFLFEIASPIRNSEFGLVTLPLIYGAKINDLILSGEWWRLVTPMFLVQD